MTDLPPRGDECSICKEVPDGHMRATVASCAHSFCVGCIVSWASVKGVCALCRAPFTSLLVCRTLDGVERDVAAAEPVALLRRAAWVGAVPVETDAFSPPPADALLAAATSLGPLTTLARPAGPSAGAPYYQDEVVEDALEALFWEDEEKRYHELDRSRRVSNRPFGPNGFVASGRRLARAGPPQPPRPSRRARAAAAASGRSVAGPSTAVQCGGGGSCVEQSGRRKKKVKKKSRAGIAAAAAAAAAASSSEGGEGEPSGVSVDG